jgi:hypothetical protein
MLGAPQAAHHISTRNFHKLSTEEAPKKHVKRGNQQQSGRNLLLLEINKNLPEALH